MGRRKATGEQWWVVLDGDWRLVSEGSVLADPLPDGLTAVKVDGPSAGRSWDSAAQAWGPLPDPSPDEPPTPDPNAAIVGTLAQIAASDATQDEKVTAILAALAAVAPTE